MRAVHFVGGGRISLDIVPDPQPRESEVVVRVTSASICGTDRENLAGHGQDVVPGHENAGIVEAVDRPGRVHVGDRVAVNCHVTCGKCLYCLRGDLFLCPSLSVIGFDRDGGYAERMLVPEASCMPLPDDISCEQGSLMVDMLGTPLQAFKRSGMGPGDAIAIWGAGPIGLALLMVAVHRGARAAVVDLSEARLAMAEKLGASLGLKPGAGGAAAEIRRWSGGEGVRAAFDCVGSGHVCLEAISALAPKGTLAVVGVSRSLLLDPWEHLICRELALFGTRNFNAHDFPEMVQLVRNGLPLTHAVTHRFPLGRAGEAFGLFLSGQCGKILIVGD